MTIHWKALEEHFLMVPLVFWFIHVGKGVGGNVFSELFSKKHQWRLPELADKGQKLQRVIKLYIIFSCSGVFRHYFSSVSRNTCTKFRGIIFFNIWWKTVGYVNHQFGLLTCVIVSDNSYKTGRNNSRIWYFGWKMYILYNIKPYMRCKTGTMVLLTNVK
jgi:hypothetical protein